MHDYMKTKMTQEQKSLFESISQNDKDALRDLEMIWDKSASYEPKIKFNKDAAYGKFMDAINSDAAPQTAASTGIGTILLRSIIAIAIAAAIFFAYNSIFSHKTIKSTDQIEFATLDDGTQIWLNKHSELRYPRSFASDARTVTLTGEAFFDVAEDKEAPFSIELSNDNVVTVLGTSFNINDRFNSKVEVSVEKGMVNLKNEANPTLTLDLVKGERGILNARKDEIKKEVIDDNFLAWRENELKFNAEELESVLEDVGTFYGVQFKLDNAVAECPITIVVNRDQTISQTIASLYKPFPSIRITKSTKNLYYVQGTCK